MRLLLSVLFFPLALVADSAGLIHYSARVWQSDDGLPQNAVQAITQTRDGYLWIGTHEGLARFDGVRFTLFDEKISPELKNFPVSALCETRDGALWIATDGNGLVRLKDGKFTRFTAADELSSDIVRTVLESRDGSLWVGTSGGLDRFENGRFTQHLTAEEGLAHDAIRALREDRNGTLWIGTAVGLTSLKDGKFSIFRQRQGLPSNSMKSLYLDSHGVLWIGSNSGLTKFENGQFTTFTKEDGLADNFVSAMYEDRRGDFWIGTYGGVNRLVNGKFLTEYNAVGAAFDLVYGIIEDREGNIWIGTKGGLNRLKRRRFTTYTKQNGLLHNNVVSVFADKADTLWIGTWGGGLNFLKDGKFSAYLPKDGLSSDLILGLHETQDGSLWIGTDFVGGLNRIKDGQFTRIARPSGLDVAIIVMHEDRESNLWIGTRNGLVKFKDGKMVARYTTAEGLAGNSVRSFLEDHEGNFWIGTVDGLTRRSGENFTSFTTKDGLSSDIILSIYEDREQTIWIGTKGGGLNKVRSLKSKAQSSQTENSQLSFTACMTRQGLFNDVVNEILEDDHGYFWMSSPKGAFRVTKKELDDFFGKKIPKVHCQAYGKADGMLSIECIGVAKPAACKTRDGRIWFSTSQGLACAEPDIQMNGFEPPVLIEEVFADQKPVTVAAEEKGKKGEKENFSVPLQISPGRGELEIHFTALSFQAPEKNLFKYKLEGSDRDWVDAVGRRVAYYNNLDPGSYRFRVMACNNDGVWNENGASLALILQPHYWQTWWFKLSVAAACGVLFVGIYQARAARQREIERLRVRIAADLHDEIGANLASIALLSQMEQSAAPNSTRSELGEINRIALGTANSIRDIVWFINPSYDTLDEMISRMRDVAGTMLGGMEHHFRAPPEPPATKLSLEFRRNIFLIFKEVLHNIVKHANATCVQIEVSEQGGEFRLRIADNGKGFDEASIRKGNGLKNIRLRAGQLRGKLEIQSKSGTGTVVMFSGKVT